MLLQWQKVLHGTFGDMLVTMLSYLKDIFAVRDSLFSITWAWGQRLTQDIHVATTLAPVVATIQELTQELSGFQLGGESPQKLGGGVWEKGSIDRTINQLL